jgi:hypothetical protein
MSARCSPRVVTEFRGRTLPEPASPAGYAALIDYFDLPVSLPSRLAVIAARGRPSATSAWRFLTPRDRPADTVAGHLTFALACEEMNLDVLAAVFEMTTQAEIAAIVESAPTTTPARRLWFLYEWLTGRDLEIPELRGRLEFVPVLEASVQVALKDGVPSPRHRVIDNLPGTRRFCPLVRWTPALRSFASKALDSRGCEVLWNAPSGEIARIAEWLRLMDARASFALERVTPSNGSEARWAEAIEQAGVRSLTTAELERVQRLCAADPRASRAGSARRTGSASNDGDVLRGIIEYSDRALGGAVDPIVVAAATAFGFVQRPACPSRGLMHRWLVHYVLNASGYRPEVAVLPLSVVFRRFADRYARVVAGSSNGSRYFDATPHAEFLYDCVEQAVEHDLPRAVRAFDGVAAPR